MNQQYYYYIIIIIIININERNPFPLKKRLWQRCFPVNLAKNFKNIFFYRTLLAATSEQNLIFKKIPFFSPWVTVFAQYLPCEKNGI